MRISRRKMCGLLPLAFFSQRTLAEGDALSSVALKFEDMKVTKNKSGDAEFRRIAKGKTPTGEQVEAHETVLQPGGAPHVAHRHDHSEFWFVKGGTVEITIGGKKYQLGPGSAGFAAGKEEHGIRNVGKGPATYFVVAIGPTA